MIALDDQTGIALSTDGVGSKVIVAEQLERYDTVGIDCVAMNVNDLVCVGAEPLALLDYIALEDADPEMLRQIALGLKAGAEQAGVEIPGGELAQLPELIRGHPSPRGFDLAASAFGIVRLDSLVTGERIAPGDAVIGLPSSGLHSNGYTLARRALPDLAEAPAELGGRTVGDELLEPTVIYVRAALDLVRSETIDAARPRPHHRRRAAEPAAPERRGGLLDRLPAARSARVRADRRARRGGGRGHVGDVQHGLRLLRGRARRACRGRRRAACRPPSRRSANRLGDRRQRRGRAAARRPRAPRDVTPARLRKACLAFPGAEETFPFAPGHSVFKVAGKIFALTRLTERPLRISLKCEPALAEGLRAAHPEIIPGYHLNKRHWNTVIPGRRAGGPDGAGDGRGFVRPRGRWTGEGEATSAGLVSG